MTRIGLVVLTLLVTLVLTASASTPRVTIHQAKLRAFAALLRQTEQPPDSADATHAAVTIGSCRHSGHAVLCHGSLSPVAFSGIDGSTCSYVVTVWARSTRIADGDCADPAVTPVVPPLLR